MNHHFQVAVRMVLIAVVAIFAITLAACGESDTKPAAPTGDKPAPAGGTAVDSSKLTAVSIQLNWLPEPQFGGFYAADIGGIYAKHGLNVKVLKGGPDVPSVPMTDRGAVEFGIAAADEVINLRSKGGDIVALYASFQTNPQGIMVHESRGVNSIEELLNSGGTLAVQEALAYVKFFRKKYDMSKVKLVAYQGGIAAFKADPQFAQQCFVVSEPIAAKQAGLMPKSFLIAESGFNPYATVVITRGAYLKENRGVVERFVKATREGWEAYMKDPKPANDAMRKINTSMDEATFAAAAEAQANLVKDEFTAKEGLGAMSKERWETLIGQLVDLEIVAKDKAPKAEDCFVNIK